MRINDHIGQVVVVTLDDGSQHKGILKLSGIEFETRRRYYEVHGGGEVYHVPVGDISSIKPA
jgi:hypothetical protein